MKSKQQQNQIIAIFGSMGAVLIILAAWLFFRADPMKNYSHPDYGFEMIYPKGWKVMQNKDGAAVIFLSPLEGELDVFQESVNVVIETMKQRFMDINSFTETAVMQLRAVFKTNLEIYADRTLSVAGKKARQIEYLVHLPEADIMYLSTWIVSGRDSIQITYTALEPQYDHYIERVEKMIKSFSF